MLKATTEQIVWPIQLLPFLQYLEIFAPLVLVLDNLALVQERLIATGIAELLPKKTRNSTTNSEAAPTKPSALRKHV